jgi:hypothetical protein
MPLLHPHNLRLVHAVWCPPRARQGSFAAMPCPACRGGLHVSMHTWHGARTPRPSRFTPIPFRAPAVLPDPSRGYSMSLHLPDSERCRWTR